MTFGRVEDCVDLLMFCIKRSSWPHNFLVGKERRSHGKPLAQLVPKKCSRQYQVTERVYKSNALDGICIVTMAIKMHSAFETAATSAELTNQGLSLGASSFL